MVKLQTTARFFCAVFLGLSACGEPDPMSALAERMTDNTEDALWVDASFGSAVKGHSVLVDKEGTLVIRYLVCAMEGTTWLLGKTLSVDDCDNERDGLEWQKKGMRVQLNRVDPASFELEVAGPGSEGMQVAFGCRDNSTCDMFQRPSIVCRDREACEAIMVDLAELVSLAETIGPPKD